jgi:mannosyltransferase
VVHELTIRPPVISAPVISVSVASSVSIASIVAAVLCLTGLGRQPLSWDESVSLNAASRSDRPLWTLLRHTDAPLGAYYAGLHVWIRLGALVGIPADETWLRLPSALAVIAAVGLVTWYGCRALGAAAGLACGLLLAVHPLVVFYAQDARPYAIAMLLAVAATGVLLSDLRQPRPVTLVAYGVLALLGLYAQFWILFVLAAHAILVLARGRRRWRYAIVWAVVGLAALPLALLSERETDEVGWIPTPTPQNIGSFLVRVCGGVGGISVMAVLAIALLWYRRTRQGSGAGSVWLRPDDRLAVALWVLVPPAALILLSFWQPMMVPRYALVCIPAWAIALVAAGLRLPRRTALAIGGLLVVVSLTATIVQAIQPFKYEDYRAAAVAVRDTAQPGDGIVYIPSSFRVGMAPYLARAFAGTGVPVPLDVALADPASPRIGAVIGGTEVTVAEVGARIRSDDRIYLIGPNLSAGSAGLAPINAAKETALRDGYTSAWHRTYGEVTVTLLIRSLG